MKQAVALDIKNYDLDATLDSGQCFRWEKIAPQTWQGVAYRRLLRVTYGSGKLVLEGAGQEEAERIWAPYFDLSRNYDGVKKILSQDSVLLKAIAFAPGLRVLKQEPWETLCSFIISQNNNIPRIKGIIRRLCESFGEPIEGGVYGFPSPERIALLNENDLAPLRSGFRAKYILDAAMKVASGEVDLHSLETAPLDQARAELRKINGVGPKVAECALLYGCGRIECFPVDVWIRRVLACLYPKGFPQEFKNFAGIAQQFLFYYARCCPTCGLKDAKRA